MPLAPERMADEIAFFHRATERDTHLQLASDVFTYKPRIQVGIVDRLDVEEDVLAGYVL
jgi:hypothetical protein